MTPYEINSRIPVYINDSLFNNIRNIEERNWNRRLSPRSMSVVYELLDIWHRRIDSVIQMLSSNSPTTDDSPNNNGFYHASISDNVGDIIYQYVMDETGKFALFIENIIFNLPWNLGTGKIYINEFLLNKNKIVIKESQLRSIIRETLRKVLPTT